mmetsp:Transcript_33788/g.86357  ORF Transcript_33788/g.86357 Transcript_33788/m.86357 type:complete len:207 (-) Transcript_33788:1043-1663(-)
MASVHFLISSAAICSRSWCAFSRSAALWACVIASCSASSLGSSSYTGWPPMPCTMPASARAQTSRTSGCDSTRPAVMPGSRLDTCGTSTPGCSTSVTMLPHVLAAFLRRSALRSLRARLRMGTTSSRGGSSTALTKVISIMTSMQSAILETGSTSVSFTASIMDTTSGYSTMPHSTSSVSSACSLTLGCVSARASRTGGMTMGNCA